MRIVNAKIGSPIHIGRQGENLATKVVFNIDDWIRDFGEGSINLVIQQNEIIYPQLVEKSTVIYKTKDPKTGEEIETSIVCADWIVTEENTQTAGKNQCELFYSVEKGLVQLTQKPNNWEDNWNNYFDKDGNKVSGEQAPDWIWEERDTDIPYYKKEFVKVKSVIYDIIVNSSIDASEATEAPEYAGSWVEEVLDAKDAAIEAKEVVVNAKDAAEGWAVGTQNGEEVAEGSPYYNNNAKYYSGKAEDHSEDANDFSLKSEGFAVGTQNGEIIEDSPYYNNNAKHYSEDANDFSLIAEGWAVGAQNGEKVTKGDYFEDNAKYYSEESKNSATDSYNWAEGVPEVEGSKSAKAHSVDANNFSLEAEGWAIGAQNGKEVTDGKYFKDNAKYYARQAGSFSASAAGSADLAQAWAEGTPENGKSAKAHAEEAAGSATSASNAASETKSYSVNPPRIGLEEGEDPDYWYVWQYDEETQTGRYIKTDSKVKFSIVAVYGTKEEMEADFSRKIGDFVILSIYEDQESAKLYVCNGSAKDQWTFVTDLTGYEGVGIASITKTNGTSQPGTKDTYTVTLTNGRVATTIDVYQGKDGEGVGDMKAENYDPTGAVYAADGIDNYVKNNTTRITMKTWTAADI